MSADLETNDAFLVAETASGTKIEILTHPDFPLGSFLLDIFLWNVALWVLITVFQQVSGPNWVCLAFYFFAATFGSLNFLIWNYWAKDSLELSKSVFKLKRHMPLFNSRSSNYQKSEVKNLHLIQPDEKPGLFEGVFGLRLFLIQFRGEIAFETPQGMIVRFGWGLSNSEAEEIVAIIQNWLQEPHN